MWQKHPQITIPLLYSPPECKSFPSAFYLNLYFIELYGDFFFYYFFLGVGGGEGV